MAGVVNSVFGRPRPPQPVQQQQQVQQQQTQVQAAAVEQQAAATQRETARIAQEEAAAEATRRARSGRGGSRTLLLTDEVGTAPTTAGPLQQRLGG